MGPPGAPDRTLYVGNLPYDVTQAEVETLIGATNAGPVARVHLPTDPEGRKRGFGFVTMGTAEGAKGAIEALRGADLRVAGWWSTSRIPKANAPRVSLVVPPAAAAGYVGGGGGGGGFTGGRWRRRRWWWRRRPPPNDAPSISAAEVAAVALPARSEGGGAPQEELGQGRDGGGRGGGRGGDWDE